MSARLDISFLQSPPVHLFNAFVQRTFMNQLTPAVYEPKANQIAWHAEAVQMLKDNFSQIHSAFCDATKRAVWFGMFLNYIKERGKKDNTIPHGQFIPWLEKNYPELSRSQSKVYMQIGRDVCEKGKVQIADYRLFANWSDLPKSILDIIEGKTQHQLLLEFRSQAEHKHHAKKITASEKEAADVQAAEDQVTDAMVAIRRVHDDLIRDNGFLATRVKCSTWKELLGIAVLMNKAVKPLCKKRKDGTSTQSRKGAKTQ
jgi:hypothetical protein